MSQFPSDAHAATKAVRTALDSDTQHGAVVPPLHLSSTYTFAGFGQRRAYDYSRSANPTRDALAEALATLEGGAGAVITASGMAAVNLPCQLLAPGDVLLAPHDCYGGTYRLFDALHRRGALQTVFVDYRDAQTVQAALQKKPKLIWVETPSNPLLRLTDIAAMSRAAKTAGALLAVDNTFMSPAWQLPLSLGADIVVHSTTKYLNGHSDVVGGAVVAATKELHDQLLWWANCTGVTGSPFDSFMTLRGVRTLHARMAVHASNAEKLAQLLAAHPAVQRVYFPGLPSHPEHALAKQQQQTFGAMVSFELKGGLPQVQAFLDGLHLFSLAESLGGVESLIAHPATMTHSALSAEVRSRAGIGDGLLRVSVGIEDWRDLERDLLAALQRAAQV
jgi:cystathionine gamma-synthase